MSASRGQSGYGGGLQMRRREALLAGLAAGVGIVASVGLSMAGPSNTRKLIAANGLGIKPAGGAVSQTAALQQAIDENASSGTPLLLPPGTYRTGTLTLRPGSQIHGVSDQTILKSEGGAILSVTGADGVQLTGLVLNGGARPLEKFDALLTVAGAIELDVVFDNGAFISESHIDCSTCNVAERAARDTARSFVQAYAIATAI